MVRQCRAGRRRGEMVTARTKLLLWLWWTLRARDGALSWRGKMQHTVKINICQTWICRRLLSAAGNGNRLICHVWFWPYMVRQSTKLSLYMVHESINKCWASVPPQYHPSGPWGSLDQSQTWFTERKPVKKSRQTTNKIFAKKEYFLTLQEKFYYSVHMWAGTL